jgi:hypothetical protein
VAAPPCSATRMHTCVPLGSRGSLGPHTIPWKRSAAELFTAPQDVGDLRQPTRSSYSPEGPRWLAPTWGLRVVPGFVSANAGVDDGSSSR